MTKEIADRILRLAEKSRAATWWKREPTPEMKKAFGSSVRAFIEMPRPGKPYGCEVLAEDYEGDDEMREAHVDFVALIAQNAVALAKFWVTGHDGDLMPICRAIVKYVRDGLEHDEEKVAKTVSKMIEVALASSERPLLGTCSRIAGQAHEGHDKPHILTQVCYNWKPNPPLPSVREIMERK